MARIFLTDIDLQNNQIKNLIMDKLAAEPGTPVVGRFFYNTTSNKYEYYNGTAWVVLDNGGGNADQLDGQHGAYYLARGNHTGTQTASTISDFSTAADARVAAAGYVGSIGNGTLTSIPVTHNLGTRDVIVQVYQTASPYAQVYPDIVATDTNTVTLNFATAPTASQYRVVVRKAA
jgi:hypothetical protein